MNDNIIIKGARENNLKNIDVTIPRNKLVVFTGVSGSGKSTLAFDTIFAEGQRKFMESLSSYARQFLGQIQKPDIDSIEGLSPSIAIDQKTTSQNPRSTVGTVTEIYDYLRLLFASIGKPYCPNCNILIKSQSVDQIIDKILEHNENEKIIINAPIIRGEKGTHQNVFENVKKNGFVRVLVDGNSYTLDEEIVLDKNKKHDVSIVVDRLILKPDIRKRLAESVEVALKLAKGLVDVEVNGEHHLFSNNYACEKCGFSFAEISPRLFSFNNPYGACPDCLGLGIKKNIDESKIIGDKNKSLNQGAMTVNGWNLDTGNFVQVYFKALAKKYKFSLDTPVKDLPQKVVDLLLYGTGEEKLNIEYKSGTFTGSFTKSFEGIIPNLIRRYRQTTSDSMKEMIEKYMVDTPCETCKGTRLKPEVLSIKVGNKNINEITNMSVDDLINFFNNLSLTDTQKIIAKEILKEVNARLSFLQNVGLNYLTLSRTAGTLSGGEAQRIRLATQIGSGLVGVLYILDEPSIGLHQRDNERLLGTLKKLRDIGNSVIVVEHDEDTIRSADFVVDIGPYAGVHGGEVVVAGSVEDVKNCQKSITGMYLRGDKKIEIPKNRRLIKGNYITIKGAKENNLKNIDVKIPLGVLTVITGVSGSGKSSLVDGILYPALSNRLNSARLSEGKYDKYSNNWISK